MTLRRAILWQFLIFVVSAAVSAVAAAWLPDRVPTHWGINGQPDAWGSKWTNLLLMPGLLLVFVFLTIVLPLISPKGFDPAASGKTYGYLMVLVSGLFLGLHMVILDASMHDGANLGKAFMGIFMLFFALMGNVLGRVKRNFWVGIRTPWTLADERVWSATHRSAGRLWLVGGLIGAVAAIAGVPMWLEFSYLIALALIPTAQSYFIYRRVVR